VPRFVVPAVLALTAALSAQSNIFPLKDVRPGMRGTGRTVFTGSRVDEFQVEILGVLDNFGPKESLILARLSGGPLEHTGVMEGMSGSPVYLDGRIAGAVAMAFPYAKDPIAAIRPIEDMLRPSANIASAPVPSTHAAGLILAAANNLASLLPRLPRPAATGNEPSLVPIATPLSLGGFTRAAIDAFAPQLRSLGLEPRQAPTAGSDLKAPHMGNPADLKPGCMISVQLLSGDLSVGAAGTVTHIDGSRVYAFGHRFLDIGATALPFARADVLTLLANVNTSFKLVSSKEWMGTIDQDRNTAVTGSIGRLPTMVPISVSVARGATNIASYTMDMVDDPLLSPLLTQMAVFSIIDSTERTVGPSTIRVTGEMDFQNAPAPIRIDNMYASDNGTPMQVSLSAAIPLAYAMQAGFNSMKLKRVALHVDTFDTKRQLTIDSLTASRKQVRAGEKVTLNVVLAGDNGVEVKRSVVYDVPIGAEPGALYFTVADAANANIADFKQVLTATPHSPAQVIGTVNALHPNTRAYVRVWRTDPAFQLEGADLPNPPASVQLILEGSQTSQAGITQARNSKIAEFEIDGGGAVISGVKTIQVEVKE